MKFKWFYLFQAGVICAVIAAVGTAFLVVGSPNTERARKLDQQRVNDISQISYAIDQYYYQETNQHPKHTLPPSLEILQKEPGIFLSSVGDPRTGVPYTYRSFATTTYALCSDFETTSTTNLPLVSRPYPVAPYGVVSGDLKPDFNLHGSGYFCFQLQVADRAGL